MHINVPGKVFIMGEYTVIDRQSKAIIAPTQRRLDVIITPAQTYRYESSFDGIMEADSLVELAQNLPSDLLNSVLPYILPLDAEKKCETPLKIRIESHLDSGKIPYGLGSSGAVRVGLIKAFMAYLERPLDALEIFQIAALSSEGDSSSYGDLAVSSFDRAILYQKPATLNPLSHMVIDPVDLPPFLIVHTGEKVSSKPFVDAYMTRRHEAFVKAYADTINPLIDTFKSASVDAQLAKIHEAHKAYLMFAEALDSNIIPESFIPIFVAIEATGGIPKVSGAGGGDNILAFYPSEDALRHAEKILVQTYPIFYPARSLDAKKK